MRLQSRNVSILNVAPSFGPRTSTVTVRTGSIAPTTRPPPLPPIPSTRLWKSNELQSAKERCELVSGGRADLSNSMALVGARKLRNRCARSSSRRVHGSRRRGPISTGLALSPSVPFPRVILVNRPGTRRQSDGTTFVFDVSNVPETSSVYGLKSQCTSKCTRKV